MAQIIFRDASDSRPDWINKGVYVFNAFGDGWYRSTEGPSKGYGLSLVGIRFARSGKERHPRPVFMTNSPNLLAFKVEIDYTPSSNPQEDIETSLAWLVIDTQEEDVMDVVRHIREHVQDWKP